MYIYIQQLKILKVFHFVSSGFLQGPVIEKIKYN